MYGCTDIKLIITVLLREVYTVRSVTVEQVAIGPALIVFLHVITKLFPLRDSRCFIAAVLPLMIENILGAQCVDPVI